MKRIVCTVLSLCIIFSNIALAQHNHNNDMMMCKNRNHLEFDKKIGGDALRFFRMANINLTEEQVNKVYDIAFEFSLKEEPFMLEIRKLDYNIRKEIMKDSPDKDLIKKLILDRAEKQGNIDFLKMERDLYIMDILTEEQKLMLKERRSDRKR